MRTTRPISHSHLSRTLHRRQAHSSPACRSTSVRALFIRAREPTCPSLSLLLFSAFIRGIPVELEESARLDGCTTWQTFRRIVLPLLVPISATVGIFAFLQSWNDFMMPHLITSNPKFQTLPVVQYLFQDQFTTNINVAFASYLMALLPTLVAFLIAQRWVVSGIMRGSIK